MKEMEGILKMRMRSVMQIKLKLGCFFFSLFSFFLFLFIFDFGVCCYARVSDLLFCLDLSQKLVVGSSYDEMLIFPSLL